MTKEEVLARLDALLNPRSTHTPIMNAILALPARETHLVEFSRTPVMAQFRESIVNGQIALDVATKAVDLLKQLLPMLMGVAAV